MTPPGGPGPLLVRNPEIVRHGGHVEIRAVIGDQPLWYRFPEPWQGELRGDAFLAAGLAPAMARGQALVFPVGLPVSPMLLEGAARWQEIMVRWGPQHGMDLTEVPVVAPTLAANRGPTNGGTALFSGGVDGTYTALRHQHQLVHLLSVRGVDMQLQNEALHREVVAAASRFAEHLGVKLVAAESNIRQFGHSFGLGWDDWNGAGLASILLAFGASEGWIASSFSWGELQSEGSHPLTDPLLSSEACRIIHDGCEARRTEKLRTVVADEVARAILRVCWQDAGYNCGRCEKCVRTRAGLTLLRTETPTLRPLTTTWPLIRLSADTAGHAAYYDDLWAEAMAIGRRDIARAAGTVVMRYKLRRAVADLDRLWGHGRLRRTWRALRHK